MEEGGEAQRAAPGELVGERLGEQLASVRGRGPHEGLQVGLHLDHPRQHLQRVPVHVGVVVRVLLDPAKRLDLRQQSRHRRELVQDAQPPDRLGARDEQAQLRELALPRRLPRPVRLRARQGGGLLVDLQREAGGDPGRSQDPQRVVGEAARRDGAQHPCVEVGEPAVRVQWPGRQVGQRDRDRVDREVPLGQVRLDSIASQPGDVHVPATVARQRPPARELLGQPERVSSGGAGDLAGCVSLVSGDGQVDVLDPLAESGVADRPANDPGALRRAEGTLTGTNGRSGGEARWDSRAHRPAERTCTRGTRGAMPQVIS